MELRNQGLRGEIKSTQAKEENKRLRGDMTGADNAKDHHKFIGEKREGRRRPTGKIRFQLVQREKIKCRSEKFQM